MLLITALSIFGLHKLQVLRKTNGSSVTVVALATVFGLRKGWFWYTIMRHGQTVNSDPYIVTLKISWKPFRRVLRCRNIAKILLQHDNAQPHTSLKTQEGTTELSDWLFFPTYHTAQILVPQNYIFMQPSNIQSMETISEWWLRYWTSEWCGGEYKIQTATRGG